MAEGTSFNIVRKGFDCDEVNKCIEKLESDIKKQRSSNAALQSRCEKLTDEVKSLILERERIRTDATKFRSDCRTLAQALRDEQKARNDLQEKVKQLENEKYDQSEILAEPAESSEPSIYDDYADALKEIEALTEERDSLQAENQSLRNKLAKTSDSGSVTADATAQIVSEVTDVVRKIEADARRKAESITMSAKLQQAQSELTHKLVAEEVVSLLKLLNDFVLKNPGIKDEMDKAAAEEDEKVVTQKSDVSFLDDSPEAESGGAAEEAPAFASRNDGDLFHFEED